MSAFDHASTVFHHLLPRPDPQPEPARDVGSGPGTAVPSDNYRWTRR